MAQRVQDPRTPRTSFVRHYTCLIVSIGHGDPPMIPVYRVERSNVLKFRRLSMPINIVGTPYNEVHLCKNNIETYNIGFKQGFTCILFTMSRKEMLMTEGESRGP